MFSVPYVSTTVDPECLVLNIDIGELSTYLYLSLSRQPS